MIVLFELFDAMTHEQRMRVLQGLAVRYLGESTQVCGWCMTPYRLSADAADCARRCRLKAEGHEPSRDACETGNHHLLDELVNARADVPYIYCSRHRAYCGAPGILARACWGLSSVHSHPLGSRANDCPECSGSEAPWRSC